MIKIKVFLQINVLNNLEYNTIVPLTASKDPEVESKMSEASVAASGRMSKDSGKASDDGSTVIEVCHYICTLTQALRTCTTLW